MIPPPFNEAKTERLGMQQGGRKKAHQASSDKEALINCTRYQMPRRNGGKKGKRIIQDPGMWPELAGCLGLVLGARAEAQWVTKPQNDSK